MITQSFKEAHDEIMGVFKAAWDTTGYPVIWPNLAGAVGDQIATAPTGHIPYARISVRHLMGDETIGVVGGQRRYERRGMVIVQIFTPAGSGMDKAYDLAKTVADAFEGVVSGAGVWFRNVKIEEFGVVENTFQVNVFANFVYDEVK